MVFAACLMTDVRFCEVMNAGREMRQQVRMADELIEERVYEMVHCNLADLGRAWSVLQHCIGAAKEGADAKRNGA